MISARSAVNDDQHVTVFVTRSTREIGDIERFWIFDANDSGAGAETEALFRRLNGSRP